MRCVVLIMFGGFGNIVNGRFLSEGAGWMVSRAPTSDTSVINDRTSEYMSLQIAQIYCHALPNYTGDHWRSDLSHPGFDVSSCQQFILFIELV